jgi:rubrerythrin
MTFALDMQSRARKFAVDCPNAGNRRAQALARYEALKKARLRGEPPSGGRGTGRAPSIAQHRSVKVCGLCANLQERRPPEGCPRCKFPAGPPAPIVVVHRVDVD